MSPTQPPLATVTTSGMAGQPNSKLAATGGDSNNNNGNTAAPKAQSKGNYKGFVAGVFSGITKLSGMSPYTWFLGLQCYVVCLCAMDGNMRVLTGLFEI